MAIAFDDSTDGGSTSDTSHTYSHTCTGSDRFLAVAVIGDTTSDLISGATYAGVAMTLADKEVGAGMVRKGYLFTLMNPASGANNVVVSASSASFIGSGAASYTGVSQTGQPEVVTKLFSDADADSSLLHSITPLTANSWVILGTFGFDGANNPPVAGSGATRREFDPSFGLWGLMDSNAAVPASSYDMTWTYANTGADMVSIMVAVAPSGPPPPPGAIVFNLQIG